MGGGGEGGSTIFCRIFFVSLPKNFIGFTLVLLPVLVFDWQASYKILQNTVSGKNLGKKWTVRCDLEKKGTTRVGFF